MILVLSKALVYTAVLSFALTPLDVILARRLGAIDVPVDTRRMHTSPTPRIGGISLFASFIFFAFIFYKKLAPEFTFVVSGAFFTVILGVFDDSIGLSAKTKLTAQTFISVLCALGIFSPFRYGAAVSVFAVIWITAFINAHNFIDGLNGLCAGVSLIEAVAVGVLLLIAKETSYAVWAFVLGGACLGFFPYNYPKARLFLGDTGSTFLGYTLGVFSLKLITVRANFLTFASVLFIFFVPLADVLFALTRRIKQQKSVFSADRSHIHHLLADKLGHKKASLVLRLTTLALAATGVAFYLSLP